ncbi:MAG: DUF1801 domain-containing protein [Patescibacteria group bacterium]
MATPKTIPTNQAVQSFIDSLDDLQQRADSEELVAIMSNISGEPAVMWGSSIIGFDTIHYKSKASEGDWMKIGFSPRKGKMSLYVTCDAEMLSDELKDLGKHQVGKGCIYIKRLSDVDRNQLKKIIQKAFDNSGWYPAAN